MPRIRELYRELRVARHPLLPAALLAVGRVVHAGRRARHRDPVLPGASAPGAARVRADARGRGRHAGMVHAHPAARDRPRASTTPTACAAAAGGSSSSACRRTAYPEYYTPRPYSRSFVAAPRALVRAEPSRRGLRRDVRRLADARFAVAEALPGLAGAQEARVRRRADGEIGAQRAARHQHAARSIRSPRLRKTLREHYADKRQRYGVDCPDVYDRDLRRLFSDAPEHRGNPAAAASSAASARRCARASRAGPASTSTRSTRCSTRSTSAAASSTCAWPCAEEQARSTSPSSSPSRPCTTCTAGDTGCGCELKTLRILALMHEDLVPPADAPRSDIADADWKIEFDVTVSLQEARPRGARPRRRRRPGRDPQRDRRVQAAHRLQPARALSRRAALRPERRQLPRAAAHALHRLQPARPDAGARQGPVEEAARLPPHPGARVRASIPIGRSRSAGRSGCPSRSSSSR